MKSILTLLIFILSLAAQDDFEKYKREQEKAFQDFLSKEDKEFIGFLKANWLKVDMEKAKPAYKKPKPIKLPSLKTPPKLEIEKPKETPKPKKDPEKKVKETPAPIITPLVKEPIIKAPVISEKPSPPPKVEIVSPPIKKKTMRFDYFGLKAQVPIIDGISSVQLSSLNNKAIAAFWKDFAEKEKGDLVDYLDKQQRLNRFSDYERYVYSFELAKTLYGDINRQRLATWYFLTKMGYKLKVGYSKKQIYLLIPSEDLIYGYSYFSFKSERLRYFAFTPGNKKYNVIGSVSTYKQNYSKANKHFSFRIPHTPKLANKIEHKNLSFKYNGKTHKIKARYNAELVRFYEYFPQMAVDVYMEAVPSHLASASLISQLRNIIKGKSESEAANMIIRFVQTAFPYKTDGDQFNREKFLFPDETIHYPASDCEDRSILYSYLVKNLLGLKVVALSYPGHIATAVKFNSPVRGDKISVNGTSFLVCDPTYINANIGMAMPQFKNVNPKVVGL